MSGLTDYANKTPVLTAKNRVYCVLRTRAVQVPAVYKTFAESVPSRAFLRGGSRSATHFPVSKKPELMLQGPGCPAL